jgi:hypothetical protein
VLQPAYKVLDNVQRLGSCETYTRGFEVVIILKNAVDWDFKIIVAKWTYSMAWVGLIRHWVPGCIIPPIWDYRVEFRVVDFLK